MNIQLLFFNHNEYTCRKPSNQPKKKWRMRTNLWGWKPSYADTNRGEVAKLALTARWRDRERAWGWVGEIERLRVRACRVDLWVGGKGELPRRWGGGRAWRGGRWQTKRVKMRVGRWGNESESKGEGEGRLTELIRFRVWLVSGYIYIWVIFIILFYTGWVRVWVRGRYA